MNLVKYFSLTFIFCTLVGCFDDDLVTQFLDPYWEKHKACLTTYSKFPFQMEERYIDKYGPLLDEFEKHGYVTHVIKSVDINHNPRGKEQLVVVRAYSLTEKGEVLRSNTNKICYGLFETVDVDVYSMPTFDGVERKVLKFEYRITDVSDWARDIEEFQYLSDELFDDISTLKKLGIGHMILKKKPTGKWHRFRVELNSNQPSKDLKSERNIIIFQRRSEADFEKLVNAEAIDTPNFLLSKYHQYLRDFPSSQHSKEVAEKSQALGQKIAYAKNAINKAAKKANTIRFQALASEFAYAIDAKDESTIFSITTKGTAASRAHKNNIFGRSKAGDLSLKSFIFSGADKELVQMQLAGNIYMLRAKFVDESWLITGYSTRSGL